MTPDIKSVLVYIDIFTMYTTTSAILEICIKWNVI